MKPWILHARLELYKAMAAQSWSGVFSLGRFLGSLVLVPTSLNEIRYVELLGDHLHPSMLYSHPHGNGVFQEDICTCHRSLLATA
ncbi:hypothetical protein AVEN_185419-1 [Araneus ventricosus]|uniref:Uncharacterized protein n=1 Tax=Araneus ventricosus TaxID=182803 RepID=A0A4Y2CJ29_ARAVE|nr:hypothetical protein AVEN_185419-1 [Araneus ventricosus]